jgi:CRP-like cAMP-binding protein
MNSHADDNTRAAARKVYACLQSLHFLHRFSFEQLEQLLAALRRRKVSAGMAVYRQGEFADAFFFVGTGRLGVWQKRYFRQSKVALIGPEEFFGENSLLGQAPRSSSVIAETDCELFVLYKRDFEQILMANGEVAAKILAHRASIGAPPPAEAAP